MVEAYLIEYAVIIDCSSSNPARAVYVPAEKLFVERNGIIFGGALCDRYKVVAGPDAKKSYDGLLADIRKNDAQGRTKRRFEPKGIELPASFVEWARKLHEVRHPPKEISDLLSV